LIFIVIIVGEWGIVHTWLLRRGLRRLLTGLILFLTGLVVFTYLMEQPFILPRISRTLGITDQFVAIPANSARRYLQGQWTDLSFSRKLILSMIENRARQGAFIGTIGIFFLIVGIAYLLVTVVLEYMKKRRYAQRSKT